MGNDGAEALIQNETIRDIIFYGNDKKLKHLKKEILLDKYNKLLYKRNEKMRIKEITNETTKMVSDKNIKKMIFSFPVVGGHIIIHELVAEYAVGWH